MINKLIELLKQAINDFIDKNSNVFINSKYISDTMVDNISLWLDMYMDNAPWINESDGLYSMGLAKTICQALKRYILSELDIKIEGSSAKSTYLNKIIQERFISQLNDTLEKALALGGFIIKPYISENEIYFNYCYPGEFYPIKFNDDGYITDIAFIDTLIQDNYRYTKVERHILSNNILKITNTAYKLKLDWNTDDNELGKEIPLTDIEIWKDINPEVTIENINKPLYVYYKVPASNNVDISSPLGISAYSSAVTFIRKADEQFSRLNWEYEGGQMAIDIDPTMLREQQTYYGNQHTMDDYRNRLYRGTDLNEDGSYHIFSPNLRDTSYIQGLNKYLEIVEDKCGLARGELSNVDAEARTATEIKIIKQRQYTTVTEHQTALTKVFEDLVDSCSVLCDLYNIVAKGDYHTTVDWQDSILTDTESELEQKLNLKREKILSRAEIRMWYLGEDEETAKKAIAEIDETENTNLLNDIFSKENEDNTTLEE